MNSSEAGLKTKEHNNFVYLFLGLLVVLLLAPLMVELGEWDRYILQAGLDLSLLLGIWSVVGQRRWFVLGVILLFCSVGITVTDAFLNLPELKLAAFAVIMPFWVLTAVLALGYVLSAKRVDRNILTGGVCVYLLMGLSWAAMYSFVDYLFPGSFSGTIGESREERFLGFLYYSFVTLTTLGYGDILPVKPVARAFAYMEAITGLIYVAVLIAGLVGIFISDRGRE